MWTKTVERTEKQLQIIQGIFMEATKYFQKMLKSILMVTYYEEFNKSSKPNNVVRYKMHGDYVIFT